MNFLRRKAAPKREEIVVTEYDSNAPDEPAPKLEPAPDPEPAPRSASKSDHQVQPIPQDLQPDPVHGFRRRGETVGKAGTGSGSSDTNRQ